MDLTDIIRNATGGFLGGFIIGVSGTCDICNERIEILEAISTPEEREKLGLGDERIEKIKKNEKREKIFLPYAIGGVYSILSGVASKNSISESMIVAIPSAYVGMIAGSSVRKLARKKNKKELQIAKQIRDDPENALSYIPDSQRKIIELAFGEIERKILDGNNPINEELKEKDDLLKRMYDAIAKNSRAYSPALLKWTLKGFENVCKTARLQREVMRFYENAAQSLSLAVIGVPEKTSLMIYEIDGQTLNTYEAQFDRLNMIEKEGVEIIVGGSVPHISLQDRKEWNGDYKEIAKQVIKTQPEHTIMLIKTPPGMPDLIRSVIVTETFTNAFVEYKKRDPRF